jgi:methyl-accepting chemotaxis protein
MANAMVGALRVTLGLNSAAFSKGIDKANKKSETFGKKIAKSMKMIAGVSAAAAGAISLAVQGVLQDADKMAKASRKIGVPIDELTELRHAAELSGVSFGGLENGLKRLSANMHDASKGIGEGAKAFDELGISVTNSDGSLKSAKDVMLELSERFEKMPDGAQKTALAMRVMGKSGADMIPLLNGGSQALEDMAAEALKLGLVFDEQTGRQAEAFNDNITRLQRSFTGLANKLTAQILPSLLALSQRMIDGISNSEGLSTMTDALAAGFNGLIRVINVVIDNFSHLYDLFKLFVAAKTVTFIVSLTGSFLTMAKGIRVAGLAMALFSAIQRRGLATFVVIAGIIAKVTGYYDDFAHTLRTLYDEAKKFIPDELVEGAEELAGELKNLVIGTEDAANSFSTYINAADQAANSFGEIGDKVSSTTDKINTSVKNAKNPVKELGNELKNAFEGAESMGQTLGDVFTGLSNKTLTWRDALSKVISSLGQMALQSFSPTTSTGGFFKGLLGGIFGGFRASGGPVSAGKAYMVGEQGPEMIVPGASGTVIPNHALSAANNNGQVGGAINVSVHLTSDSEMFDAKVVQISGAVAGQQVKLSNQRFQSRAQTANERGV